MRHWALQEIIQIRIIEIQNSMIEEAKEEVRTTIKILVANQSPIMASALAALLDSHQNFEVVATTTNCTECCASASAATPDIIICDLLSANHAKRSSLACLRNCLPDDVPTMVITDKDHDQHILQIMGCNVKGLMTSDTTPASLFEAVRIVASGGCCMDESIQGKLLSMLGTRDIDNTDADLLNERERAILELMGNGLTNEQIGEAVFLSKSSVKYHNKAIFRKLGVSNRAGAVKVATREGLIA